VVWTWERPYVLGILNVTPDSFSDGARYPTADDAVAAGLRMVADGADAIDVGGASTRPGASEIDPETERARVLPVVSALAARGLVVSIDSTKAEVADAAMAAGAVILNDVGMGDSPAVLGAVAARHGGAYIAMHARGQPATMRVLTEYGDVVADVCAELRERVGAIERAGVPAGRIIVDPGIGFAKTADQSLKLLANVASLRALGYPVCVGPSRKSFIDAVDAYGLAWHVRPSSAGERIGGTAAAVTQCVLDGVEIVRVHDVAAMAQAARVANAMRTRRVSAGIGAGRGGGGQ